MESRSGSSWHFTGRFEGWESVVSARFLLSSSSSLEEDDMSSPLNLNVNAIGKWTGIEVDRDSSGESYRHNVRTRGMGGRKPRPGQRFSNAFPQDTLADLPPP